MRIDGLSSSSLPLEYSIRPGPMATPYRDVQYEVETRREQSASASDSQGFEQTPQTRKVQASSAGGDNPPVSTHDLLVFQRLVSSYAAMALTSYNLTADLDIDTGAEDVLGLSLYAWVTLRAPVISLLYFLGCPSWNEATWRGGFYSCELCPIDYLGYYGGIFNAVEDNTTFYARPSAEAVRRWAETMPAGFRFRARFPRDISHEGDLREWLGVAGDFLELLTPLGERVSPLWLQLSAALTPQCLDKLLYFLDGLSP